MLNAQPELDTVSESVVSVTNLNSFCLRQEAELLVRNSYTIVSILADSVLKEMGPNGTYPNTSLDAHESEKITEFDDAATISVKKNLQRQRLRSLYHQVVLFCIFLRGVSA